MYNYFLNFVGFQIQKFQKSKIVLQCLWKDNDEYTIKHLDFRYDLCDMRSQTFTFIFVSSAILLKVYLSSIKWSF